MMSKTLSLFWHVVSHSSWGSLVCGIFPSEEGAHVPVGISALACVSSGGDEDVMLHPEGSLECCPHWISLQVSVNEIICFLSKDLRGRKKDFFFFLSNKVLCSKLIDKILVWLCTCFKSLPKSLASEVVCNRLKYIKVYFCVKLL